MTIRPAAWLTALRHRDDGTAVLAAAIAFAAIIALLSACFQAALWFTARNAALAAAQQGASAARAAGATLTQGEATACAFAATAGRGMLRGAVCTGTAGTTISVTVCGDAAQLIPLFGVHTCEQAQGPKERFTTP